MPSRAETASVPRDAPSLMTRSLPEPARKRRRYVRGRLVSEFDWLPAEQWRDLIAQAPTCVEERDGRKWLVRMLPPPGES
jgi:hypothetical protein